MSEKHLTVEDLAEREGVPVKTVYEWNHKGTGPARMRVGNYVRYRLADVQAWEKSRVIRVGGGGDVPAT